jgi:hypothetical protein
MLNAGAAPKDALRAWRIRISRICQTKHNAHRHERRSPAMRELQLKPMVGRTQNETALRFRGLVLFLRHRPNDVRALLRALLRSQAICVVLPADAPSGWLDFWADQSGALAEGRVSVRFVLRSEQGGERRAR